MINATAIQQIQAPVIAGQAPEQPPEPQVINYCLYARSCRLRQGSDR